MNSSELSEIFEKNINKIASMIAQELSVQPRWMTLKQASIYSNIGKSRLIELGKRREIAGFRDSGIKTQPWRFDKKTIDNYMKKLIPEDTSEKSEKIALDILTGISI